MNVNSLEPNQTSYLTSEVTLFAQVCAYKYFEENGPVAEKRDLRTYANSEDPVQPGHPRRLVRFFAVRLYKGPYRS